MQKTIPTCIKEAIEMEKIKNLREEPQPTGSAPINDNSNLEERSDNTQNSIDNRNINENRNSNDRAENDPQMNNENNGQEVSQPNVPANENAIQFAVSAPYPEITNAEPSLFEVRQLKWLASSRKSEFSALNTYLYQNFILKDTYPEIAKMLLDISIVEMEHFERLSEAIVNFGGDPNLTDGRGNVWTGRNISKLKNVRDILSFNLKAEREAVREYEDAAIRTRNESLRVLYLRIAEDEKLHIQILERLFNSL